MQLKSRNYDNTSINNALKRNLNEQKEDKEKAIAQIKGKFKIL